MGKMLIIVASLHITRYQPQETEAVYNVLAAERAEAARQEAERIAREAAEREAAEKAALEE